MLLTVFIWFTTIYAVWMAWIWKSSSTANLFLKTVFFLQAVAGTILLIQKYIMAQ